VKVAIASFNEKIALNKFLKKLNLNNKLDVVITAEDVKRHKPYPDVFLKAAKQLNVNPKFCVGVEDAPTGVHAIKKANMIAVGILSEFTIKKDFNEENVDLIISNMYELNYKKLNKLF